MDNIMTIISTLITAGAALIGVVLTNMSANKKMEQQLATAQAITNTKIENLTEEVKRHNVFSERIPAIETKIEAIEKRLDKLEDIERNRSL